MSRIRNCLTLAGMLLAIHVQAAELPGKSVYQIGGKWLNTEGKGLELKTLRGKPTILAMVYLSCGYTCPTIISEVQRIEKLVDKKSLTEMQIVLVSFDPKRDTPLVMKAYGKKRGLAADRWVFLTNTDESRIRELAAALDFKYQKDDAGDFTHSYSIIALDRDGVIQKRIDAVDQDVSPLAEAIKKMASGG